MKSLRTVLISVASAAVLAAAAGLALASDESDDGRGPLNFSVAQVASRLESAGYRDITEIERERRGYEVEATDPDGARVELRVDGDSGEIVRSESDD